MSRRSEGRRGVRSSALGGFAFRFERFLTRGVHTKVIALWGLLLLLSLAAGALARLSPATHFTSVSDAVFWAFLRLTDPGHLAEDRAPGLLLISIVISVLGLALFVGVLVAIITQAFVERMDRLALGLTPVSFAGHVAVLGWTNRTLELVAALLEEAERPPRVVVLVQRITEELEQGLRDRFSRRLRFRLTLRTGDPEDLGHLARVLGRGAETIVLLGSEQPGLEASDARTLKVIASLDRVAGEEGARPRLVAELADLRLLPVAQAAYRGPLEVIPSELLVGRSISLGILAPGLSRVLADILDARSGCTFRTERHPALAGESVAAASRRFANAVVLGVLREVGEEDRLEAGVERVLREDDRLLLLAPVDAVLEPGEPRSLADDAPSLTPAEAPSAVGTRRVLVLGWSGKVPDLSRELGRPRRLRWEIDVLSRTGVAQREAVLAAGDTIRHLVGDPTSPDALGPLDLDAYDCIVVVGSGLASDASEADSRTIASILLLEHRLSGRCRRPHVIAELLDPANRAVLEGRGIEIVVTPDLIAGLLAGVVSHPELGGILEQLLLGGLGVPGAIPLERIAAGAQTTTFGEIERLLHGEGASCLGLQRESRGFALELVPDKRELLRVGRRDRALVLRPQA